MQFLQEIIGLSYIHFYPEVEKFLPQGAKNQQLYQAIRSGEVTTDQEASRLIYGSDSAGKKYTMLKQRLKQQVTDNYFRLLSQTNEVSSPPLQRRLDYLKQLTIVYTLMGQGRYTLARQLLYYQQKAAATRFDLVTVQEGLVLLRRMAGYQGDRVAFRRYGEQLRKVTQLVNQLQKVRGYYEMVRMEHRRHMSPSLVVADLAHQHALQAKQWQQDSPHPVVGFYGRLLQLMVDFHQGQLSRCRRLLLIQQQQVQQHSALGTYDSLANADQLAIRYLSTQYPKKRSEIVERAVRSARDESLPAAARLALREIECVHWLRTANYDRAEQVCQQLEAEAGEETFVIPAHDQARWALFQAYISYLLRRTQEGTVPASLTSSVASLEVDLQPLLTDSVGYGWQWFVLKLLLWLEAPFLPKKSFLRQIDTYARRHLPKQSARAGHFFQNVRLVITGKYASSRTKIVSLPAASDDDRLRELVSYDVLWKSAVDRLSINPT